MQGLISWFEEADGGHAGSDVSAMLAPPPHPPQGAQPSPSLCSRHCTEERTQALKAREDAVEPARPAYGRLSLLSRPAHARCPCSWARRFEWGVRLTKTRSITGN